MLNNREYIKTEFPPDSFDKYPSYMGYRTSNRDMLFYWFAVQHYDLHLWYQDEEMILYADEECCVTDMDHNEVSDYYRTANELIRNFRLPDGKTLLDVVDDKSFWLDIY